MNDVSTTPSPDAAVDETAFREAMRHLASGVTVITIRDHRGQVHGMTATAFCSLSLDPPLVMLAVASGSRCHGLLLETRRFGVSILFAHQAHLSRHFGGSPDPNLSPAYADLGGSPALNEAMVKLSCRVDGVLDGGDHTIFTGLVKRAETRPGEPLIHFGGEYRGVAPRP